MWSEARSWHKEGAGVGVAGIGKPASGYEEIWRCTMWVDVAALCPGHIQCLFCLYVHCRIAELILKVMLPFVAPCH